VVIGIPDTKRKFHDKKFHNSGQASRYVPVSERRARDEAMAKAKSFGVGNIKLDRRSRETEERVKQCHEAAKQLSGDPWKGRRLGEPFPRGREVIRDYPILGQIGVFMAV
jgi:hypothetical protein